VVRSLKFHGGVTLSRARIGCMKRRDFITSLGGAVAAWPLGARAQQSAMPVIGFLHVGVNDVNEAPVVAAFAKGLSEAGYLEGRDVAIDYRWAQNDAANLYQMAADLVRRQVALIFAYANVGAAAAKAATPTIPIVFAIGGDPVNLGFVSQLNRPDGNITGVSFLNTELVGKRLELLHECLPGATTMAVLINPTNAQAEADTMGAQEAARRLGVALRIFKVSNAAEMPGTFANLVEQGVGALFIEGDALFQNRLTQLIVLTARHGLPAIWGGREFPDLGGLMSYGADRSDAVRIAGVYAGRILKGEKIANLPAQRSTKVELVVNVATARALGLTIPTSILSRADDVIE
jgi:putative tryptophan/tyrosine transport system substrate-binding protein